MATLDTNLVIAKNNAGEVYWPIFGIVGVTMRPGQGYQLYLKAARTLVYPANAGPAPPFVLTRIAELALPDQAAEQRHYQVAQIQTGRNAILGVESRDLRDGDEIGVWSGDQLLVGNSVVKQGRAVVAIWGDDEMTKDVIEGAQEGENLSITAWSQVDQKEKPLTYSSLIDALSGKRIEGSMKFRTDAVWIAEAATEKLIPSVFFLDQNYPNPFNPTTTIKYGLPRDVKVTIEIYNLLGQKVVTLVDADQKAGYYDVKFEAMRFASGVYFYRISAGDFRQTKKLLLLR